MKEDQGKEGHRKVRLTGDDSDDAGVKLVLVRGSFILVGEALPPSEGGGGKDFNGKKVPEEVIDVAIGVGATKLEVVTGGYGDSAS